MNYILLGVVLVLICVTDGYLFGSNSEVEYQLYTRTARKEILSNSDELANQLKNFTTDAKTYFLVHGWKGGKFTNTFAYEIADAILQRENSNVIYVNWGAWAKNRKYRKAQAYCDDTGRDIATMIVRLEAFGASRSRMHLIGHSLGGQVVGFAGAVLQSPKIARITGLDSAEAGFNCDTSTDTCLDPSDAEFVDEIHTFVSKLPKGHADFYPILTEESKVNYNYFVKPHGYPGFYFAKSILSGPCSYEAVSCSSKEAFTAGAAGQCNTADKNHLGFFATKPADGQRKSYFLKINYNKPC